jgi:hypothetical protein
MMVVTSNGVNGNKKILEKQRLEKDGMNFINKKIIIGKENPKNTILTSASNQNLIKTILMKMN